MQGINDLELNPLFRALQTEFVSLFRWVQQKRGLICVPHSSVIAGIPMNEQFVKMHIFQPSPFLKDQFLTHDGSCSLSLEDNFLVTGDGFPKPLVKINILGQELGYNKKSEKFRILVIDHPLVGEVQTQVESNEWLYNMTDWTLPMSRTFLEYFTETSQALKELDVELKRFRTSYIVLADYLNETAQKLCDIWTRISQMFLSSLRLSFRAEVSITENIQTAVECCLLCGVHDSVWSAVCQRCQSDDTSLVTKCQQLCHLRPSHMSLPVTLDSCDFSTAVNLLELLDLCACPREKLCNFKSVLESVTAAVNCHLTNTSQSTELSCLTSDDYISLLVLVIIQHRGQHLASNLLYIETFQLFTKHADSLSYSLVTFKATYKYILTLAVGQLAQQTTSPSLSATTSAQNTSPDTSRLTRSSRVDWELEQITRLLATTTTTSQQHNDCNNTTSVNSVDPTPVTSWKSQIPHHGTKNSSSHPLGDFLLSLKSDSFQTSFGKQN